MTDLNHPDAEIRHLGRGDGAIVEDLLADYRGYAAVDPDAFLAHPDTLLLIAEVGGNVAGWLYAYSLLRPEGAHEPVHPIGRLVEIRGPEDPLDPPSVSNIDAKDGSTETAGAVDLVLVAAAEGDESETPVGDLTFASVTPPPANRERRNEAGSRPTSAQSSLMSSLRSRARSRHAATVGVNGSPLDAPIAPGI